MIVWYWYVAAAAALSFTGYIRVNLAANFLLAALIHILFHFLPSKRLAVTLLKAILAAAAAVALLWRESFLPPASTLISFLANPVTRPSADYLLGFIRQSINVPMAAAALLLFAAVYLARRKESAYAALSLYLLLGTAWLLEPKKTVALGAETPEAFFKQESGKLVEFAKPAPGARPFDVIIVHICSLSWKDIKDSGYDILPFFSRFDYVFTNFSSATGYSKLAPLHVLKSACGQLPAAQLAKDSPAGCYLMDNLRSSGYKTFTMLNHDGRYDNFSTEIQKYGHAEKPLGINGLQPAHRMFDGTFLYSDKEALDKFWKARQSSGASRAAVYYNTVNLHIGTHRADSYSGPDDAAAYKARLAEMTGELEGFFLEVEKSGRNAVVFFVPEHGAALTGTKMQAKDLREIPLPPIALVPTAVKLIGKTFHAEGQPQVITSPASLHALAWLTTEFLRNNPYSREARKPAAIAAEIPVTGFLAENFNASVMRAELGYVYKLKGADWAPLPSYAGIPPGTIPAPQDFARQRKDK